MSDVPPDFEHVPCLFCGTTDAKRISERGQYGLPCFVSICTHDGLVYLSPRWTRDRYARFYRSEYDRYYRTTPDETDESRYGMIRRIAEWIDVKGMAPTAVLDVGAGMGWGLDYLSRVLPNPRLAAIEASTQCTDNLQRLGVDVLSDDIDADWDASHHGAFDLVILRHVLEHMLDPVCVLRRIRNVLAPGGHLYVAVPNNMDPRGVLDDYWFRVVHTYYFSRVTLEHALRLSGFDVSRVRETEFSDVWCLCTATDKPYDSPPPSTYDAQMRVIRRHRRREPLIRIRRKVSSLARRVLPM